MGKGEVRLLSPQLPFAPLFASVFISLNITLLEPGTGYLSCDKNGNFVAAPYCERYQATFTSIHVQYSPLVQVLKPSSTSRRKGCTGKQFTDYKSMRIKIILQCLKSKIYKHLKFWITELILLNYTVRRMLKILWKFLNWTLKIVS